jgi:glucan phosphoethanolaminetransferase (alkaline phosphatase superfamily)
MMSRRTIRIVAFVLVVLIAGASTVFTYDVVLGRSITDTFVEPDGGCYG